MAEVRQLRTAAPRAQRRSPGAQRRSRGAIDDQTFVGGCNPKGQFTWDARARTISEAAGRRGR
jgi:hypothetical protein